MNTTIILTSTVNVNFNKCYLYQTNKNERIQSYLKSVLQWLNNTKFKIILVENSGYDFNELSSEKDIFRDRFEVISFNERELKQCEYLKNNNSKGASELFAINYAVVNSKIINDTVFLLKITARYFIPELEEYLKSFNFNY